MEAGLVRRLETERRVERLTSVARAGAVRVRERVGAHVDGQGVSGTDMGADVVVGVALVDHPDEHAVLERGAPPSPDAVRLAELVGAFGEGRVIADVLPVLEEVVRSALVTSVPVEAFQPLTVHPCRLSAPSVATTVWPMFTEMLSRNAPASLTPPSVA